MHEHSYVPMNVSATPRARRKIPVYRPSWGKEVRVLITNSRNVPVYVHWDGARSREHREPAEFCEWCVKKQQPLYTSYLGCWHIIEGRYGMVEITRNAMEHCADFNPASTTDLRGLSLELWKEREGKTAPVRGKLGTRQERRYLPPPLDMARALETLWSLRDGTLCDISQAGDGFVVPGEFPEDAEDPEVRGL